MTHILTPTYGITHHPSPITLTRTGTPTPIPTLALALTHTRTLALTLALTLDLSPQFTTKRHTDLSLSIRLLACLQSCPWCPRLPCHHPTADWTGLDWTTDWTGLDVNPTCGATCSAASHALASLDITSHALTSITSHAPTSHAC